MQQFNDCECDRGNIVQVVSFLGSDLLKCLEFDMKDSTQNILDAINTS